MDEFWRGAYAWLDAYSPRILGAVLVLAGGWVLMRLLVGPLRLLLGRSRLDPAVTSFLVSTARTLIFLAVLLAALRQLGVETASLLTLLGAAGLAVALSLQGSLANFASGLLLLAFRMVRIGDLIEVGDVRGRVSDMLPFHVVLDTPDNQRITVPNTLLTTGPVRNNTALPTRRIQWTVPVPPRLPLPTAKDAVRARLAADPRVLHDPAPRCYVQEWTADKRVLAVLAWVATADAVAVQQELLEDLGQSLEGLMPAEGKD